MLKNSLLSAEKHHVARWNYDVMYDLTHGYFQKRHQINSHLPATVSRRLQLSLAVVEILEMEKLISKCIESTFMAYLTRRVIFNPGTSRSMMPNIYTAYHTMSEVLQHDHGPHKS